MAFILSLIAGFGTFFFGRELFRRTPPYPLLDSLRLGRLHYLIVGVLVGLFFPKADALFQPFDLVRSNCIGAILLWVGLQTGLSANLQHLRNAGLSGIYAQVAGALATGGFAILAVLASDETLYRDLGLVQNLPIAAVLLASFALATRLPAPFFQWPNRGLPHRISGQDLPLSNIAAMVILCVAFPLTAAQPIFSFGNQTFIGPMGMALLMLGLGVAGGVALDFSFRSHRTGSRAMSLVMGIAIALFGLSQAPGLPALGVGFLAGAWLINATVAKREVAEFTARANDVIEPIFFALLGTLIGEFVNGPFFAWSPLLPLAFTMLLVRGMGRTIGFAFSQNLWEIPRTGRDLFAISWHPQGTLAVALAAQAVYLLEFQHNAFMTGLVMAAFLSQLVLVPPTNSPQSHA